MSDEPRAQKPKNTSSQTSNKTSQAGNDVKKEPGAKESMTNEGGTSCTPSDKKSTDGGCN